MSSERVRKAALSARQESAQGKELEGTRGLSIGRVSGVEIRLDWSLLIIFGLVIISLGGGLFPRWHPDWSLASSWFLAAAAGVLLIGSILLHELSHALVAQTQGMSVPRITLFVFGGMAHMDRSEPPSPKAEFMMAFIGPIVSILIGVVAVSAGLALAGKGFSPLETSLTVEEVRASGPLATLLFWLGPINIILGLFNLVPGFPLDGGRVLRSALWALTNDITKATRWAAGAGQAFAWFVMALGVIDLLGGAFGQGLWLLLIGWFLNNAARMSYQQLVLHKALKEVPVSRLMQTHIHKIRPDLTVESLVRDHLLASEQQAFPVEEGDALVGLVCLDDVRRIPHHRWPTTTVGEIMTASEELSSLEGNETADRALEELARRDVDQIPILDGNHLLGLVRRSDIVKWFALQGS